jgi:D-3-phosphoglycerate dehydrogenase / 2-oxoglutarate reductase
MIAALRAGHLAGAALDTYTFEPLRADHPQLELARDPMSNLILTPHVAGGGVAAVARGRVQDYDNIMAVLNGGVLLHQVA